MTGGGLAVTCWYIKRMHAKLSISHQADLVRLVLTTAGLPLPRA